MSKYIFRTLIINYLRFLSYIKLKTQFNGKVIAVAGCYGKSSAITILENIFKNEHKIYTSSQDGKGLNSETGIPFVILNVKPKTYSFFDWLKYCLQATAGLFKNMDQDFLILELGVDKPNDMKFLVSFIKPNSSILLNSNNSHSALFEDLQLRTNKSFEELIAYENGYVFEEAKDFIFYNLDDPEVVKQTSRFSGTETHKIAFSSSKDPCIKSWKVSLKGTEINFIYKKEEYSIRYPQPLLDEYKDTFIMALKVAEAYNLNIESVRKGLESFELPPSRCSLFDGVKGSYILDSSYNSAFVPASAAIKLTENISNGRKIAILGDMRELGILSEKEHRKLAHVVVDNKIDIVLTVGPNMRDFFNDEFTKIQKKNQEIYSFNTTLECLEFLKQNNYELIQKNDVVLVKSSQNTLLLEIIVEELLKDKSNVDKLCRRGEYYDVERKKLLQSA